MPCRSCQREQFAAQCSAVPCHLLPYGGTSNFHFLPIHPVFGSNGDSGWRGGVVFISSFHLLANSAKHPADQLLRPPACPARRSSSPAHLRLPMRPTRVSQTHRKTKIKNILSCFISFTDEQTFQQVAEEHDAAAIFTYDDFIILSPQRPSPRKFDKSQNL